MRRAGRRFKFLNWKVVLGVGLSLGLLYFALRGVDPGTVIAEIARADPLLFIAAVAASTFVFWVRAWRWKSLLEPVRSGTSFRSRFAATTIGFMGNNVLPVRLGEFARAYALARTERMSMSASLGSLVAERLFDFLAVVLCLAITVAMPAFPAALLGGKEIDQLLAVVVAACVGATVVLYGLGRWPQPAIRLFDAVLARWLPAGWRRRVLEAMGAFLTGLAALRNPYLVLRASSWTAALWLLNGLAFWLGFKAFDIQAPFSAAVFLQALVALAVVLPSAPGFFGLYEAAVRVGLVDIWGIELNKAMGFAIGIHIGGYIPVTLIGLAYVWRIGLSWSEVKKSDELVGEALQVDERDPPDSMPGG